MRPRTKPNGVAEQYKELKRIDENIEHRVAILYNDNSMRYDEIAQLLGVKIDTIRYIHNKYIEGRIDEHKRNKKTEDKQNNTRGV